MKLPSTHASQFLTLRRDEPRQEAWEAVHARYREVILCWCRRRGLSHACAEDLSQEIWLKLHKDIAKFDPAKGRLGSWLKAVVNNALTDYWRRQRRKPERCGVGGTAFLERLAACAEPETTDELNCGIEHQPRNTAAEVLARVRQRLHESTWQACYQTLVERRPAREVARELGLSVSAVYKDTYRVKQMLHEEYQHMHPDAR